MPTLNRATSLLFHIAARSPLLAREFGIEPLPRDRAGEEPPLKFLYGCTALVLEAHDRTKMTFDPDLLARKLGKCSSGEHAMYLFILNVWNPGYAKTKGWNFDLFHALNSLDSENSAAIAWWLERPIWP